MFTARDDISRIVPLTVPATIVLCVIMVTLLYGFYDNVRQTKVATIAMMSATWPNKRIFEVSTAIIATSLWLAMSFMSDFVGLRGSAKMGLGFFWFSVFVCVLIVLIGQFNHNTFPEVHDSLSYVMVLAMLALALCVLFVDRRQQMGRFILLRFLLAIAVLGTVSVTIIVRAMTLKSEMVTSLACVNEYITLACLLGLFICFWWSFSGLKFELCIELEGQQFDDRGELSDESIQQNLVLPE